jgi:FkbM family methyltransferase
LIPRIGRRHGVARRPASRSAMPGSLAENMTATSVELVARAIDRLAASGVNVTFEIKTHQHWRANYERMTGLRHTSISTSDLSNADYRRWLAEADVLLIAYNFDAESRDYIRYSLANKLPECLASGAAVFALGPEDVGTISTLAAIDAAEIVTVTDDAVIDERLRHLIESPDLRFALAGRAQAVAFSQFDIAKTRQAFEATVNRVFLEHQIDEYPRDVQAHTDETAVVADLLRERRGSRHVMLDVGAHTGSSAVKFDVLDWSIHCFEPHPVTRAALVAHFKDRRNVHIDPRAVGERPATNVALYDSPESTGIATLEPFHPSHRVAAQTDVTTVAEIMRERRLSTIDFLKIDVEGVDFSVLKGVPWDQVRPDVIECEFEDAKTIGQGHTWRDIGTYLQDRGYTVYVSEWHPIVRYGIRHEWRRVLPMSDATDVDPAGWGNLLAFADDPGLARGACSLRSPCPPGCGAGDGIRCGARVTCRSRNGATTAVRGGASVRQARSSRHRPSRAATSLSKRAPVARSISVVIRCLNEADGIGRLLQGIAAQTVKADQIVVVDSGSTDGTLAIARRHNVDIHKIKPAEFSFGRSLNRGIAAANR